MVPAAQLGLLVENIGVGEIVVIAFLALVVLGPDRIPEMARSAGRLLNNAKKFTSNMSGDMQDVINDPAMQPIRELGEFATRPRQKLAEYALEAEAEERQRMADEAVRSNEAEREGSEDPAPESGPEGVTGGEPEDPTGDEARTESEPGDRGTPSSGMPGEPNETGEPESGGPDTGAPDAGAPDTGAPESDVPTP